ncbi:MAG: hypothetical protein ABR507_04505 [Actinomycetota bacterium]|nr:hypothetical protein [Actinomycetota bacterium]
MSSSPGRDFWATLSLLDLQLVDKDGLLCGKVDDIEFEVSDEPGALPVAKNIIVGPSGLASRMKGRFAEWIEALHRTLHPDAQPIPAKVSFGVVKRYGSRLELTVSQQDLTVGEVEDWVQAHVISRIPGAGGQDWPPSKEHPEKNETGQGS